ncbi:CmpA/NrtA family ABC transporter substrate-binding protein [Arenibaculum pallidiluteum]|uniref:CmpA/NrtA family ABC transporter substrate-binding protein n=1 Tax=Arenibaculum pallidiluteum TaxID=2812559 RepID=UPI001A9707DB|nr:CmpA/NrtA family ABC transporter substrate-binding protein [Arenibaculum pallidiluteum]
MVADAIQTTASGNEAPERPRPVLGFVPLADAAPLIVAAEKGFFAAQGLEPVLARQASWANIRDRVAIGALDAAHMLAPMTLAARLDPGRFGTPFLTAFAFNLGGNAITVSETLWRRMSDADPEAMATHPASARALKTVIEADRAAGREPPVFASVFPFSPHNYELRYWLAAGGIDPDRDLRLTVVPPPRMAESLRLGLVDGYCVGEPWNSRTVEAGLGRIVATSGEIWSGRIEKVLGVTEDWAARHPATHRALIRALIEAGRWLDEPCNHAEAARLLAAPGFVDAPASMIEASLAGRIRRAPGAAPTAEPGFYAFHRHAANFPWRSQAVWYLTQMLRWGQVDRPLDLAATADAAFRPDIFREAVAGLGLVCPVSDHKPEGAHAGPWTLDAGGTPIAMGPDRFLDGRVFDAADPLSYLRDLPIKSDRAPSAATGVTAA